MGHGKIMVMVQKNNNKSIQYLYWIFEIYHTIFYFQNFNLITEINKSIKITTAVDELLKS